MRDTEAWLARAREGDPAALDSLFARHRGRLLALLHVRMGAALARAVDPEDVLQETLLQAARKLDEFEDRGPGSFYAWLVGIARFKASEAERARHALKRAAVAPLDGEPEALDSGPPTRAEHRERADRLREAIESLPKDQGEAVRLRYLEAFSVAQTAERLGRSEAAVKALVSRGLDALAERLRPGG